MSAHYPNEIGARPPRITIDTDEEPSPARAERHRKDAWFTLYSILAVLIGIGFFIGGTEYGKHAEHLSMCQAMQTYGVRCEGVS